MKSNKLENLMKNFIIVTICLLVVACTQRDSKMNQSTNSINSDLKKEVIDIFNSKLENEESFQSYSSRDVFYEIKADNLSLKQFIEYHNKIIPDNHWVFLKKVNNAYIYCKKSLHLEVVPPQILLGNNDLGGGDINTQLVDKWNIAISQTVNGTLNSCYLDNRIR